MSVDTLNDELREYLVEALYCVPGEERVRSHWVMSAEWLLEIRKLTDPTGAPLWTPSWSLGSPDLLHGLPIEIRKDGGAPHLEAV